MFSPLLPNTQPSQVEEKQPSWPIVSESKNYKECELPSGQKIKIRPFEQADLDKMLKEFKEKFKFDPTSKDSSAQDEEISSCSDWFNWDQAKNGMLLGKIIFDEQTEYFYRVKDDKLQLLNKEIKKWQNTLRSLQQDIINAEKLQWRYATLEELKSIAQETQEPIIIGEQWLNWDRAKLAMEAGKILNAIKGNYSVFYRIVDKQLQYFGMYNQKEWIVNLLKIKYNNIKELEEMKFRYATQSELEQLGISDPVGEAVKTYKVDVKFPKDAWFSYEEAEKYMSAGKIVIVGNGVLFMIKNKQLWCIDIVDKIWLLSKDHYSELNSRQWRLATSEEISKLPQFENPNEIPANLVTFDIALREMCNEGWIMEYDNKKYKVVNNTFFYLYDKTNEWRNDINEYNMNDISDLMKTKWKYIKKQEIKQDQSENDCC